MFINSEIQSICIGLCINVRSIVENSGSIAATFTADSKKNLITFTTPATNMKIVYATSTISEVLGISADTTSASTTTTGWLKQLRSHLQWLYQAQFLNNSLI